MGGAPAPDGGGAADRGMGPGGATFPASVPHCHAEIRRLAQQLEQARAAIIAGTKYGWQKDMKLGEARKALEKMLQMRGDWTVSAGDDAAAPGLCPAASPAMLSCSQPSQRSGRGLAKDWVSWRDRAAAAAALRPTEHAWTSPPRPPGGSPQRSAAEWAHHLSAAGSAAPQPPPRWVGSAELAAAATSPADYPHPSSRGGLQSAVRRADVDRGAAAALQGAALRLQPGAQSPPLLVPAHAVHTLFRPPQHRDVAPPYCHTRY